MTIAPKSCVLVLFSAVSMNANAALMSRLDGLAYYDTVSDLTWLADANYAFTSGYATQYANGDPHSSTTNVQASGAMGWEAAMAWVVDLEVAGVSGWRLPTTLQPDPSCSQQSPIHGSYYNNCTGSEMGNMFYNVLGGVAGYNIGTTHNNNYYLFSNVGLTSWSSTERDTSAWSFAMRGGNQRTFDKSVSNYAWAVHDGDVAALASVPLPAAAWLFGGGFLGLIGVAGRRRKV